MEYLYYLDYQLYYIVCEYTEESGMLLTGQVSDRGPRVTPSWRLITARACSTPISHLYVNEGINLY